MNFKNIKWKLVGNILAITLALFYLIYFLQGLLLIVMAGKVEQMYNGPKVPVDVGYVTKIALWVQGKAIISLLIACFAVGFYILVAKRKLKVEGIISIAIILVSFWFLRSLIR